MKEITNIKISICIPIYGVEKYIERCAISLFEQTYNNIEYVFINDCSKDKSVDILQNIIKKYPERERCIFIINHKKNLGLAAARNTAINVCTGEFIMHVDSDDYIEKETVELAIKEQQKEDSDIVSFGCFREYPQCVKIQEAPLYKDPHEMCKTLIRREANVGVWGRLYKKTLYTKNNIKVKEGINMAEDYQITPILAYYAKKVSSISKPLYHYNLKNTSSYVYSFSEYKIYQLWQSFEIIKLFFNDKDDSFKNAIYSAELKLIVRTLIDCAKYSSNKEIFEVYRLRLNEIPKEHLNTLSPAYRIIIYIKKFNILKLYIKASQLLHRN
ncbi:glycosyltransferase family 2 protein [Phocaeicola sp.]